MMHCIHNALDVAHDAIRQYALCVFESACMHVFICEIFSLHMHPEGVFYRDF